MITKLIYPFIAISVVIWVSACTSQKQYHYYSTWDGDDNLKLGQQEFIEAYVSSGYFSKWSSGDTSISYHNFYSGIFQRVDEDSSITVLPDEFYRNLESFSLLLFDENFHAWDDNQNKELSDTEFSRHIAEAEIACQWDLDHNNLLSDVEVANGIFYRTDLNRSGWIDRDEFDYWLYFR